MTQRVDLREALAVAAELGTAPMLLSVDDDGRPRAAAVDVTWDGSAAVVRVGRRSLANATARPAVSLLWPAPAGGRTAVLVDGWVDDARPDPPAADRRGRPGGQLRVGVTSVLLHGVPGGGRAPGAEPEIHATSDVGADAGAHPAGDGDPDSPPDGDPEPGDREADPEPGAAEPFRVRALTEPTAADLAGLVEVLLDCVRGGASVGFMAPLSPERALAFWRGAAASVERGERALVVAEDASGVLGTAQVVLAQPDNQPHRGDVAKMLVHRRARRRGVGAALLRAVEELAAAAGKTLLVLDTASTDAERLYERGGWERVGSIPDYALLPDGGLCGTVVYYRRLPA